MLDFDGVHKAIKTYFDGFYAGDAAKLNTIFHGQCNLYSIASGKVSIMPIADYLALVRKLGAVSVPQKLQSVINVTFSGEDIAVARVAVANAEERYDDFLVLARDSESWKVVSKAYHATALAH